MSSKKTDQIVCSTDDVTIRESDLRSLGARQFLSDVIVSFASTELERSMPPAVRARVALLQATTAFLGAMMDVEPELVANLKLTDKELVALPVNNNDDANVAFGGTHWSLLVYVRALDQFWYYDSMREYNLSAARVVARNFARALGATKSTTCKTTRLRALAMILNKNFLVPYESCLQRNTTASKVNT